MKKARNKRTMIVTIAALLVIVAAIVAVVAFMNKEVDSSLYKERKELLLRLTESCSDVVTDNILTERSLVNVLADKAKNDLQNYDTIEDYFEAVSARPYYIGEKFFFVDTTGKYYSSDGAFGKIISLTYYTDDSATEVEYISNLPHMDSDELYMIFRHRFDNPIKVMTSHGEVEIAYCGLLHDISTLTDVLSEEFAGDNNTFIYDTNTGTMLYKEFGIKLLIDGFNIYPKFEQSERLFGENADDLVKACKERKTVVTALEIDGIEYYFCSANVGINDWSLAFVIQESYLSEVSGNAFSSIIFSIALIAIILGIALFIAIALIYSNKANKKVIEETNDLNLALITANNAKSEFLSNMSHDIRTPINGIMGMTTIAKAVPDNPEKTQECLDKIDGASHHLLALINDVLDMSRIERGATKITNEPLNVFMLCDNCSSIIKGQMSDRDLNFELTTNGENVNVIGDSLHLRQVLINILGNAIKFTPDGGSIKFSCNELSKKDDIVEFEFIVEDNGRGMSEEFIGSIFEAFSQEESEGRTTYKGTGLGMAITKQLVELMNGKIAVSSKLGEGSKFIVTIPFEINNDPATIINTTDVKADINGVKILIVEDNELNMEIAEELLTEEGAIITKAFDGQEGFKIFNESEPGTFDVILMDIMMPIMNGLEATEAIRGLARDDAKTIPILAMTANAFEEDIRKTKEAGMDAHLSKPIQIDIVVKTIAEHVNK